MKYPCNLIRDLMPLYHDQVSSPESSAAVEAHFQECAACREYYEKLCGSDEIEPLAYDEEMSRQIAESYRQVKRKNRRKIVRAVVIALLVAAVWYLAIGALALGLFANLTDSAEIQVHSDIAEYARYRKGEEADDEFQNKWGMDESIWPEQITAAMEVQDYVMVYYNPWDAQFLGYLMVDYDQDSYLAEVKRLAEYESTDYIGYYGVTGFEGYELMAICADPVYGFVYALTDGEDTVIYVETIFCNYFMDLDYTEYIPEAYLPEGFDAARDNAYRQRMLGE